ncbi:TonB-dependent receptor [Tenacibaculum sp. 190130A14a]|uniref:TonB-dependent receptor plug domain-containing protein n=1 Tax=Tenacibaculum polynesiense TaxID=3137857 RepID=UPI0032B2C093
MDQSILEGATIHTNFSNTVSNQQGYFETKVRFPSEKITIRFLGHQPVTLTLASFSKNECKTIYLQEQEEKLSHVSLTGYLVKGIDKVADGSIAINFSEFSLLPGLIETDVLHSIQALPGIQSADETVSNINIRGGSHDQNLILWDDIKMYQSGHFFGLISSFNPQITQKAIVITNGTDASFSNGVSGTIHMKTDDKIQKELKGSASLNFINANAFLDLPLGKKSSLQIAARRSIDEWVRTPTYEEYFERVTQNTEVQNNSINVTNSNQEFKFYDTSLRWLYKPSKKDEIRINFITINNDLTFDETATINTNVETKQSSLSQNTIAGGISYKRNWTDDFSTQLNLYETDYKLQAINVNIFDNQRFLQENIVSESGAKLQASYHKYNWKYNLGYNFTESKVTNLNDVDNPRFLRLRSDVIREHALFAQIQFQNLENDFIIKPGIRFNYIEKFNKTIIEPRISVHKKISSKITTEVLGEFKHQNVSQIINFQNDFLGIEKRRWQLSDDDEIPVITSKQLSFGISYKNKSLLLDAKGYYKTVNGITTQSQSFTTKYEFEKAKGSYNVWGAEFLARKKLKNLNTWLSYSFLKNKYTFKNLEDRNFPSNFDFTHSITLGNTYTYKAFKISAGINYQTGKPTSQPVENQEIVNNSINFGNANNSRLSNYFRMDASATYRYKISEEVGADFGVAVWNVTGSENAINNYYRINQSANEVDKFTRLSLGLTTNVLVRFYFN